LIVEYLVIGDGLIG